MLQILQREVWRQTWDVVGAPGNNSMGTVMICCRYCRQQYAGSCDMLQILQTAWKELQHVADTADNNMETVVMYTLQGSYGHGQ